MEVHTLKTDVCYITHNHTTNTWEACTTAALFRAIDQSHFILLGAIECPSDADDCGSMAISSQNCGMMEAMDIPASMGDSASVVVVTETRAITTWNRETPGRGGGLRWATGDR